MCFTVAIDRVREELEEAFSSSFPGEIPFVPAYYFNAFDHPQLPVITSENPERFVLSRWGLVPQWVRDRRQAEKIRNQTVNARTETVTEKPSFRHLTGRRHGLLPVTGFYEWHDHHGKKMPYFLQLKDRRPFVLAGLYDHWTDRETGEILSSFTLLTVPAGPLLARIHNTRKRMPLMLDPSAGRAWLSPSGHNLLQSYREMIIPEEQLNFYPVDPRLSKKAADPADPSLVEPYDHGFDPLGPQLF